MKEEKMTSPFFFIFLMYKNNNKKNSELTVLIKNKPGPLKTYLKHEKL